MIRSALAKGLIHLACLVKPKPPLRHEEHAPGEMCRSINEQGHMTIYRDGTCVLDLGRAT